MSKELFQKCINLILIGIIITWIFCLAGCGTAMSKACKELTKAHQFMIEAHEVALIACEKDPNIVSEDDLILLEEMTETIRNLQGMACDLKDILGED